MAGKSVERDAPADVRIGAAAEMLGVSVGRPADTQQADARD